MYCPCHSAAAFGYFSARALEQVDPAHAFGTVRLVLDLHLVQAAPERAVEASSSTVVQSFPPLPSRTWMRP